jgi:predicted HicB family RNase H-like nuclease
LKICGDGYRDNLKELIMDMADCIGFHIKLKENLQKEYSEQVEHFMEDDGL